MQRVTGCPLLTDQEVWTEWVSEAQTITAGLGGELKNIARWEGSSQLALSLRAAPKDLSGLGVQPSQIFISRLQVDNRLLGEPHAYLRDLLERNQTQPTTLIEELLPRG